MGGYFIAMKGPSYDTELKSAENAIKILGGAVEQVMAYHVDENTRSLIKIKKIKKTQYKYPRVFGKIKNKPLT